MFSPNRLGNAKSWFVFPTVLYSILVVSVTFIFALGCVVGLLTQVADTEWLQRICSEVFSLCTNPMMIALLAIASAFPIFRFIPVLIAVVKKYNYAIQEFPGITLVICVIINLLSIILLLLGCAYIGSVLDELGVDVSASNLFVFGSVLPIIVTVAAIFALMVRIIEVNSWNKQRKQFQRRLSQFLNQYCQCKGDEQ